MKPTNVMDGVSRAKKFWADCEKQSWWKYYNLISGTVNGFLTTVGNAKNSDDIIDNGIDVRDMKIEVAKLLYSLLHSQKERVVEMCEDLKPDTEKYFSFADGYKLALSDLKTKIKEEL